MGMSLEIHNVETRGIIFNIQRYSIHDGDGIRTLVFLKGCVLRCKWCANPEGMCARPQLRVIARKCMNCGACAVKCKTHACRFQNGMQMMNWAMCRDCGACVPACPAGARELMGRSMTVEEVMAEVRRDSLFFRRSSGGLTLSGGEALLQPDFAAMLLRKAHEEGIDVAIETCGCVPWDAFQKVIPHTDLFFFDLKHMNPEAHRRLTGSDNAQILSNARALAERGARIIFRTPVIPGLNDSEENIRATSEFVRSLGKNDLELLPYHQYGVGKYAQLGLHYELDMIQPPEEAWMDSLRVIVRGYLRGKEIQHIN